MALSISKKGLDIVLTFNSNEEKAKEVVKEIESFGQKGIAIQLNVNDSNNFAPFFDKVKTEIRSKFGAEKIDYLVNNAGIGINTSFSDTTEEQLDTLYTIQFKGPYLLTQRALKLLNDGGGIVNISTGLTRFALNGFSAYASMNLGFGNMFI